MDDNTQAGKVLVFLDGDYLGSVHQTYNHEDGTFTVDIHTHDVVHLMGMHMLLKHAFESVDEQIWKRTTQGPLPPWDDELGTEEHPF